MQHMHRVWILMVWMLPALGGVSQQTPLFTLHMTDKYQFNPAFAGLEGSLSISGVYRSQWNGLPGSPVQQHLDAHMPLYILNGAGGISFDSERIGAERTIRARLSYNYVYQTAYGLLSVGAAAGFLQKSLDGTILRAPEGDYEGSLIIHNDANLPEGMSNGITGDFSFGVYFAGDYLEAGVAVNNIPSGQINLDGATYKGKPVVNAYGEYLVPVTEQIDLYPSVYVQTDFNQFQSEIAARVVYGGFLTLGAGLRGYNTNSFDAVSLLLGLRVSDHVDLAYAYDITLSSLAQVSSGSHEVVIRYNLRKSIGAGLPPPVIYSPRFY